MDRTYVIHIENKALKLLQMAEMLKLYHIAIRFHPPWLRKHRHTSPPNCP